MYGIPSSAPGSSSLARSIVSASRRSSVQLVTDQTSAATSQSWPSNCWASSAQRTPTPEASSWARGLALGLPGRGQPVDALEQALHVQVLRLAGCWYGSLYRVM